MIFVFISDHWNGKFAPAHAIAINWVIPSGCLSAGMTLLELENWLQLASVVTLLGFLNVWGVLGSIASIFRKQEFEVDLNFFEKTFYCICVAIFCIIAFIDTLVWMTKLRAVAISIA
jgi:hypothetical protein